MLVPVYDTNEIIHLYVLYSLMYIYVSTVLQLTN